MKIPTARILMLAGLLAASPVATYAGDDDDRRFKAVLSGGEEVPPVETRTRGKASFKVNRGFTKLRFRVRVRAKDVDVGLLGAAGAHIHCAPPGANGPVVAFLAGDVPAGFDGKVKFRGTLTDVNIVDDACGTTIAELVDAIMDGDTYVNVHSLANPSGEVRGQIMGKDDDDDED